MRSTLNNQPENRPSILHHLWEGRADLILIVIFLLIISLYALLMFKNIVPIAGLVILGLLGLIYTVLCSHQWFSSPMDLPVLALLALLPFSLSISIDQSLSLPKIYGLVLSIALFFVLVNLVRTQRWVILAILALVLLSIATTFLGVMGIDWTSSRLPSLSSFFEKLPFLSNSISSATAGEGINANTMGGALTFLFPLLVVLLWNREIIQKMIPRNKKITMILRVIFYLLLIVNLIIIAGLLLFTESWGSILGCFVSILILVIWKDRRFLWLIPIIIVGFYVVLQKFSGGSLWELASLLLRGDKSSITGRLEAWKNAIYVIRDFPYTGVGIGTFSAPYNYFYTYITETMQGVRFFHAHNNLLSAAIDLGIPGLVLYTALLGSFFSMASAVYKTSQPITRALIIGLTCGMLAHQVFGILDAFSLGKKMGVIMWIYFGLMTAIYVHKKDLQGLSLPTSGSATQLIKKQIWASLKWRLKDLLIGLINWLLFSLAAIAFVNVSPYICLALAVLGGFLLGILLTRRYEETSSKLSYSVQRTPESSYD